MKTYSVVWFRVEPQWSRGGKCLSKKEGGCYFVPNAGSLVYPVKEWLVLTELLCFLDLWLAAACL